MLLQILSLFLHAVKLQDGGIFGGYLGDDLFLVLMEIPEVEPGMFCMQILWAATELQLLSSSCSVLWGKIKLRCIKEPIAAVSQQ